MAAGHRPVTLYATLNKLFKQESLKAAVIKVAVVLFWLLIWYAAYLPSSRGMLPVSPARALGRLLELSGTLGFWMAVGSSCLKTLSGFSLAVLAGGLLAVATAASKIMYTIFRPVLEAFRVTPAASLVILALLWVAAGDIQLFASFFAATPVIWANVCEGIKKTDRQLLEMAGVFRFSPFKKLEYVYIPSVAPYIVPACSAGLGLAWKAAISAEIIALPAYAVGKRIYDAKIYHETGDLFAWVMAVVIISVIMERAANKGLEAFKRHILKTPEERKA